MISLNLIKKTIIFISIYINYYILYYNYKIIIYYNDRCSMENKFNFLI